MEESRETISEELFHDKEEEKATENKMEENAVEENKEENTVDTCEEQQGEDAEEKEEIKEDNEKKESGKDGKSPEKKSFFKKKKDKKDEQLEELQDRLVRNMAEFDNFRKRSEKEKAQMFEIGAKDIIEKILPVLDNFERGLGTVSEEEKESAFVQGIEQIYKQFVKALEDAGVKPIEAVGQKFDPNFHNAVMHGEDEELGENIVSEEFQKGYMYRETVVRHSMVKVVN